MIPLVKKKTNKNLKMFRNKNFVLLIKNIQINSAGKTDFTKKSRITFFKSTFIYFLLFTNRTFPTLHFLQLSSHLMLARYHFIPKIVGIRI